MKRNNTIKRKIREIVLQLLQERKDGILYSDIINYLREKLPDVPVNTFHGSFYEIKNSLLNDQNNKLIIPERGYYILEKHYQKNTSNSQKIKVKEEDFYESFAEYLVKELEECTKAIPLGGNKFQDKWGTPDVFGVFKFSEADPIRPPLEIISAEIKTDISQLITAFGQACAYKIFSHKVYLVVPKQAGSEIPRLESLCFKFGLGLIIFNNENADYPDYQIRTRAIKTEPDYFYVNQYIQKLDKNDLKHLL